MLVVMLMSPPLHDRPLWPAAVLPCDPSRSRRPELHLGRRRCRDGVIVSRYRGRVRLLLTRSAVKRSLRGSFGETTRPGQAGQHSDAPLYLEAVKLGKTWREASALQIKTRSLVRSQKLFTFITNDYRTLTFLRPRIIAVRFIASERTDFMVTIPHPVINGLEISPSLMPIRLPRLSYCNSHIAEKAICSAYEGLCHVTHDLSGESSLSLKCLEDPQTVTRETLPPKPASDMPSGTFYCAFVPQSPFPSFCSEGLLALCSRTAE